MRFTRPFFPLIGFMLAAWVILFLVTDMFLIPALRVAHGADYIARKQLAAISALVLAIILTCLLAILMLVLRPGLSIEEFTRRRGKGFKIGTNAVRRAAYARRMFPEVEVIHFRGAADTRVRKLDNGEKQRLPDGGAMGPADALIMARSGLERVGLAHRIAYEFPMADMLPAVGQGIVAVECAARDWETRRLLALIDDPAAHACADAEREVLWVLNGHCNSPIAGFATIEGMEMSLTASVLDEAGQLFIEASRSGPADRPRELGRTVGLELLQKGAADIIERSRPR